MFWVALIGGLAPFLVVFALDLVLDWGTMHRLFAFTAGLAGSAVWWAFFARFADRELRGLVEEQLTIQQNAFRDQLQRVEGMLQHRADILEQNVPSAIYLETNRFDLRFHRDLTCDLERSTTYWFRGISGVWVPARVLLRRQGSPRLREVKVLIVDPRSEGAMEQAVRDYLSKDDNAGKSVERAAREMRAAIQMTIVGLFDVRRLADTIKIELDPWPVRERTELFDDVVYDGDIDEPRDANYPRTAKWPRQAPRYAVLRQILRDRASGEPTLFKVGSDEAELHRSLARLGLDDANLASVRNRYRAEYIDRLEDILRHAREFSEEMPTASSESR